MVAEGSPWGWGCASCRQVPWGSLSPSPGVLLLLPGRDHPGGVGGAHLALPASGLEGGGCVNATLRLLTPRVTGISHKPLPSACPYCLHFPIPSLGPRVTCPPAPHVPCSCAWAESYPLPSLAARGMIWATGTSAGGPAMPVAPGGAGGWHLLPTCPGAGSAPCNLSDSCAGSPHATWHHLCLAGAAGSALARDIPWDAREGGTQRGTWRHAQSICAPSVLLPRARGCALCLFLMSCAPFPAPRACTTFLLPVPALHSLFCIPCSLCLLPMPPPALLPWLGGVGALGQGQQGSWGQQSGLCLQRVQDWGSPMR